MACELRQLLYNKRHNMNNILAITHSNTTHDFITFYNKACPSGRVGEVEDNQLSMLE